MKFVLLTERWYDEQEEVFPYAKYIKKINGYFVNQRTTDDPRKIPFYVNKPDEAMEMWFDYGERHRIVDGWITRDDQREFDIVEFETTDKFMEFLNDINLDIEIDNQKMYRYEEEYIGSLKIKDNDN